MFTLPPKETECVIEFRDNEHKLSKLYEWGLISETARNKQSMKKLEYFTAGMNQPCGCEVVGYIPYNEAEDAPDTVVILVEGQLHKIMPAYLKELQKGNAKPQEDIRVLKAKPVKEKVKAKTEKQGDFDFVAIDFETANNDLCSACSVGLAAVNDNKIVDKKYYLINPKGKFDKINTEIHGLTAQDVADAPDFSGVWPEIAPYIENNLLVAHNAKFDMSVLKCCLDKYHLNIPVAKYACSIDISDYAFPAAVGKSLKERTSLLGISLENAHNALDDTVACAKLVMRTLEINQETSLQSFLKYKKIKRKSLIDLKQMTVFKKQNKSFSRFNQISIADIAATVDVIDNNSPIYEKAFVFTGELSKMSREEAMQHVVNLGGIIKSGVSKKINYLVVGIQDESLVGSAGMSSKEVKARELIKAGVEINVINEQEFLELVGQ